MGADGLSYVFDLEKSQPGIDSVNANLGKTEKSLDVNDTKLKELQDHLNKLRAPAEIDRLRKAIVDIGKPMSARDEIGQLQQKLSDLRAPAELQRVKKEIDDFGKPKPTTQKDQISTLQQKLSDLKAPGEIKRLEKEIANYGKPISEGWKGVGHSIEEARGKLHNFLEFSGALATVGILSGITHSVFEFGKEAVNSALKAERLDESLKLRFGVEGGEELDNWAGKFAHLTQLSKDQIKVVGAQLLGAGVENEDLNRYTGAALDYAAKSQDQDKNGAAMQATQALAQAARFGKVSARTVTNLGLSNDSLRVLPEYAKLKDKALRDKMNDGTITQDQLLTVLRGKGKLGEAAYAGGKDMGSKLKNVSGMWDDYLSKLTTSQGYDNLKGKLGQLFEELNPDSPKGKEIFAAMDSAFTGIIEQVGRIDFGEVASTITNDVIPAVKQIAELVGPTIEAISTTVRGLSAVATGVGKVWNFNFGLGKEGVEDGEKQMVAEILQKPNLGLPKSLKSSFAKGFDRPAPAEPSVETGADAVAGMSSDAAVTKYSSPRFSSQSAVNRSVQTGDIIVNVNGGGAGGDPAAQGAAVGRAAAGSLKSELIKANRQAGTEMGSG